MTNYYKSTKCFIHFLAPTLCGIKPANLFTLAETDFNYADKILWKNKIQNLNLCVEYFKSANNRWTFFVYDFLWIKKILSDSKVQNYLQQKNYSSTINAYNIIEELIIRLKTQNGFPHEIGLFLGYPIEDVICFEENQGRNCKYCGYWKSYCNPESAKKSCSKFNKCSQMCKQWFDEGLTVSQIIKKYKEVANAA